MTTKRLSNGNDTYTTKIGDEAVYALKGNDKITIQGVFLDPETDRTTIRVFGGPGADQILSRVEVSGQEGYGGPGNDRIEINGGDDSGGLAVGAGGDDVLICLGGDEGCLLDGGEGSDRLSTQSHTSTIFKGGPGKDTHTGGAESSDSFRFAKGDTVSGANRGTIAGFQKGQDEIDLSAVDANTNQSGNQAFTLVASTNNPAVGQVSYFKSGTSTIVVADTGAVTFQIELKNFDQPLEAPDFSL
jgi:hypothetical protein